MADCLDLLEAVSHTGKMLMNKVTFTYFKWLSWKYLTINAKESFLKNEKMHKSVTKAADDYY